VDLAPDPLTFAGLMALEPHGPDTFIGVSEPVPFPRVYGGQVAAQGLRAAAATVEDQYRVHSLHAYFLRPGDPGVPILYEVDRIRDGRSFTTRRVVAIQHGKAIFNLAASFQVHETGLEHQLALPDVMFDGRLPPDPETLPDWRERMAPWKDRIGDWYDRPRPIDHRSCDYEPMDRKEKLPPHQRTWLRADGVLPDDQVVHNCVLTYASDMTLLDTSILPHGLGTMDEALMMASLDHAMWFHRPFRADEWLLYVQDTPSASGGRGTSRGLIYTQEGQLAVSVVQEGLIRILS